MSDSSTDVRWARWAAHPVIQQTLGRFPRGAILLASLTLAAYILGLVRSRVFARTFGAGSDLDVYNAALTLPDLILDVLVVSGLSAAFVPILLRTEQDDPAAAQRFARTMITGSLAIMVVAVAILFLLAPLTVELVAPGFDAQQRDQYTSLFRLMCGTVIMFAVATALGELLVARQRFLTYGLALPLYNLGMILGALVLGPRIGIEGAAIGTLAGAAAYLGIRMVGAHRTGFRYRPTLSLRNAQFREYVRLWIPRAITQPIEAVTLVLFTRIASGMAVGSVSSMNIAREFQSAPTALIGIAFSIAAFPILARVAATGDRAGFRRVVRDNVIIVGVLSAIAGIALALLADILIRVLIGGGAFDDADIAMTSGLLVVFAISVPLEGLSHVLVRAIFATHDTILPIVASLGSLTTMVAVLVLFQSSQGLLVIPLAFTAGMGVKVCILAIALRHRISRLGEVAAGIQSD